GFEGDAGEFEGNSDPKRRRSETMEEVEWIAIESDGVGWHVRQFLSQKRRMDSAVDCGEPPERIRQAEHWDTAAIIVERAAESSGSCAGSRSALDSKNCRTAAAVKGKKSQPGSDVRSSRNSQRGWAVDWARAPQTASEVSSKASSPLNHSFGV